MRELVQEGPQKIMTPQKAPRVVLWMRERLEVNGADTQFA
jgi:hypothetical protein